MTKRLRASVKVEILHFEHLLQLLTLHTLSIETLFCFKDLTFLTILQHKPWNEAHLMIAIVTASASTLM